VLQWVVVLVFAYLAYHYLGGENWLAAGGVILVYLLASTWLRVSRERSNRLQGAEIVGRPLSDSEKVHFGDTAERNERLAERRK
jgi:hypothetical protein